MDLKGNACAASRAKFKHIGFRLFSDNGDMIRRCVTCGSKSHYHKDCTRPGGGADPSKDSHWEEYRARRAEQQPAQAAAATGKAGGKGKGKKGKNDGKMNGKNGNANSINTVNTATPSSAPSATASPPAVVTALACKAKKRTLSPADDGPEGGALLDSGANVACKYVARLEKDLEVVAVTMGDGKVHTCARKIGVKGMPTVFVVNPQTQE